jgi:hypothetical protein
MRLAPAPASGRQSPLVAARFAQTFAAAAAKELGRMRRHGAAPALAPGRSTVTLKVH